MTSFIWPPAGKYQRHRKSSYSDLTTKPIRFASRLSKDFLRTGVPVFLLPSRFSNGSRFCACSPLSLESVYMDLLIKVFAPVLEWLFFVGMAGSALVVVISFIEDIHTMLEKD